MFKWINISPVQGKNVSGTNTLETNKMLHSHDTYLSLIVNPTIIIPIVSDNYLLLVLVLIKLLENIKHITSDFCILTLLWWMFGCYKFTLPNELL